MRVAFTPFYKDNPYQQKLMDVLRQRGYIVSDVELSMKTLFIDRKVLDNIDVLHFHWLERFNVGNNYIHSLLKTVLFLIGIQISKGVKKFVWTAHNLQSHDSEHPVLEKWFLKRTIRIMDAIIVHNKYTKERLVREYGVPSSKLHVIPHPNYIGAYPTTSEEDVLRLKSTLGLGTSDFVYMILGKIRPYKGVLMAIDAFRNLNLPNTRLLICGSIRYDKDRLLIEKAITGADNIIVVPKFIEDKEISAYLALADIMIYPYRNILTSGALLLGMSYKKACVVSDIGSMHEFLESNFRFGDVEELKVRLTEVSQFSKEKLRSLGESNYQRIKDDTWDNMSALTVTVYKSLFLTSSWD